MAAKFEQLGLIGCGLMGGSFALALKRAGLVKRVVGYSKFLRRALLTIEALAEQREQHDDAGGEEEAPPVPDDVVRALAGVEVITE